MAEVLTILAIDAGVIVALFALVWAICTAIRDCTPMDSLWGFGLGASALGGFAISGGGTPRRLALTAICVLWAVRLGSYMLWRIHAHGPDGRYRRLLDKAREERGWGFGYAALRLVFLKQLPMLWLVSLPVQVGQAGGDAGSIGLAGRAGIALALFGIAFESTADWQLVRFRADPANSGKVLDTGLWRYTRHPNYFGDACVWVGLWLIAAEAPFGLWTAIGPAYLIYALARWSGVPTIEGRMRRRKPDYKDYIRRTPGFVPWFPKAPAGPG